MSTAAETTCTPEDLLTMPDHKDYELVDGQLVELNVSTLSNWVGGQVHCEVNSFLRQHPVGWVWPAEQGYVCFPDAPGTVRKPAVTFIRNERMPEGPSSEGYIDIPPDLAVEVVSPNDLAYEVEAKVVEYLNADVPLIWVIYPEARTTYVHRGDGSVSRLREKDEFSGEDVIPGFRCPLANIFPKRVAEEQPTG